MTGIHFELTTAFTAFEICHVQRMHIEDSPTVAGTAAVRVWTSLRQLSAAVVVACMNRKGMRVCFVGS